MPTASPINPFLAAFIAIILTALAALSGITLPLHYNSDPHDRLGLIARVVVIGICMAGCYQLCRVTRGLGRAIPLLGLIAIIGLVVNTVVWARG